MHSIQHQAGRGGHKEAKGWLARSFALAGAWAAVFVTLLLTARSADMNVGFLLSDPMMWAVLSLAAVVGLCVGGLAGLHIQRLLQAT